MQMRLSIPRRSLLVLAGIWFALYCSFTLVAPPLLDDADSVHAEVAREMVQRHDWVTLYANGIRYLEKAPLLYWSMAAGFKVFGVREAAARFPLALYALALALVVEVFARRAFRSARAGLYAGAIVLTSFGVFIFTRILIPDAIVCLWLTLALYCFWLTEQSEEQPSTLACLGFGVACALNILTKGLIGLVFPVGIAVIYLLLTRGARGGWKRLARLHPLATLAVFVLVAAPWHVLAAAANPSEGHPIGLTHAGGFWHVPEPTLGNVHGWTWFYFMNEHVLRYLNLRVPRDYDTVPLLLFWGLCFVWMMPWSAFAVKAMLAAPWRNAWRRKGMNDEGRTRLLLGIAALVPLVFFSFSTRQEYYVLPSLPALAMLIAKWMDDEAKQAEAFEVPGALVTAGQRISLVLFVLGSLISVACLVFFAVSKPMPAGADLSTLLKQNPGEYALSFGHFLDLNAQAMGAFRGPLLTTAAAFFGGTLLNWILRRNYKPASGNAALFTMCFFFLIAAHLGLQTFAPVLGSYRLAMQVKQEMNAGNLVVINDEYEGGSTLGFYLRKPGPGGSDPIHILHGHSANLWYGSFFTDAPKIFETDDSMAVKWAGRERVFLWTAPEKIPSWCKPAYIVAEGGGKEIVSNTKNLY